MKRSLRVYAHALAAMTTAASTPYSKGLLPPSSVDVVEEERVAPDGRVVELGRLLDDDDDEDKDVDPPAGKSSHAKPSLSWSRLSALYDREPPMLSK